MSTFQRTGFNPREEIMRKARETDASCLDSLFTEEDKKEAAYDAHRATRKTQEQAAPHAGIPADIIAQVRATQAHYTPSEWARMARTTVATFSSQDILKASETDQEATGNTEDSQPRSEGA